MVRPLADYATTVNRLIAEMGMNTRVEASASELAQLIDEPVGRVTRTLQVMRRVGTLQYEMDPHTGTVAYTLVGDLATTESRMREQGIEWSAYREQNKASGAAPKQKTSNGSNGLHAAEPNAFSALAPLRKSEPRAEIEVARKYRDQQLFIEEERKRFADMGLVMPEPSPVFDGERRRELETVVRILPYIESLERTNERLDEQNRTIRKPQQELNEARAEIARQKEQIERLVREKVQIKDDVQKLLDDHKRILREKDDEIRTLKERVGSRSITDAVKMHEINKTAAKLG